MAMTPSPAELHYFLEVAHTGNISRAAERLGISQPSLSLAIKRLEDNLGTDLLIRNKGGVTLTRSGEAFAVEARGLVSSWEQIRQNVIRGENELCGRYSIGCHESVGLYTLKNFIPQFVQSNPELEFSFSHGLSRRITDDIINFKVDFGIVVNPIEHPDLIIKLLARDEVTLWTTSKREPHTDINSGKAVLITDPDLIQSQSLYKQLKKKRMSFARTLTTPSLEVITSLTAAGTGVGILPGRVAQRDPNLDLQPVRAAPKYTDRICLIYRADAQKTVAAKKIAEAIATCLK